MPKQRKKTDDMKDSFYKEYELVLDKEISMPK
jgi:hypothetical protein